VRSVNGSVRRNDRKSLSRPARGRFSTWAVSSPANDSKQPHSRHR
jgi:hypothetical protein